MSITPIVEYAELEAYDTENSTNQYALWGPDYHKGHMYWKGVTDRLKEATGLYVFYDSLTKPLYVGIAPDRKIWIRANESYNVYRERNGWILTADHPANQVAYNKNKVRRLRREGFSLADVATYFSAYEVSSDLVYGLEAFAIRAFGATLLNTKMEGNGGLGLNNFAEE